MPLPPTLRPAFVIRRKALRQGLFGSSRFWKLVAYGMLGRQFLKRFFGKRPEVIEVATLKGAGHVMRVETMPWQSRRERRRGAR